MGEYSVEIGRKFLNRVCTFFDGKFGFKVVEHCYQGRNTAAVRVKGNRFERFDILMDQSFKDVTIRYFCECKSRGSSGAESSRNLKAEFVSFLKKANNTTAYVRDTWGDNHMFMFISNVPFGIWNDHLEQSALVAEFAKKLGNKVDATLRLLQKVRIFVIPEWLVLPHDVHYASYSIGFEYQASSPR